MFDQLSLSKYPSAACFRLIGFGQWLGWAVFRKYLGWVALVGGWVVCGKIRQIRGRALTDAGPAPPHNLQPVADLEA